MGELQYSIATAFEHQSQQGTGRRGVIPAPVMGWNTNDPEPAMDSLYAVQMDNYFPDRGVVKSRRGSSQFADTMDTGAIGTLFNWTSGSMNKLFAVSNTKVYDVTTPAIITEAVTGGVTSARWRTANINGHGIMVNGTDAPLRVDSTGMWVAHGYTGTGLTPANLNQVTVHKNRIWFLEKDTANLWYGDTNAVTGPLSKFNLGLVDADGGNCVAVGSLTLDTGVGVDDLLAVFMERGQVLIYAGTNPASISEWQLSGKFALGPVVGDRPLVKLGGDLIAITSDGYIPLLQFLGAGREQRQLAISDKIAPTLTEAVRLHGTSAGWQPILHSPANWLLFNVGGGEGMQHVMNVQTGAWCRFKGMQANCWETFQDKLYFGTAAGKVFQADTGGQDGTMPIQGTVRSAFNYLQSPYDKQFRMLRAHIESGDGQAVNIGASADYDRAPPMFTAASATSSGTKWDTAKWDTFKWGSGRSRSRQWLGVSLTGSAISVHVSSNTIGDQVFWYSSDVLYNQVSGGSIQGAG